MGTVLEAGTVPGSSDEEWGQSLKQGQSPAHLHLRAAERVPENSEHRLPTIPVQRLPRQILRIIRRQEYCNGADVPFRIAETAERNLPEVGLRVIGVLV